MPALFRHLKLGVDYKLSDSMTYRDRINNALSFWFGAGPCMGVPFHPDSSITGGSTHATQSSTSVIFALSSPVCLCASDECSTGSKIMRRCIKPGGKITRRVLEAACGCGN